MSQIMLPPGNTIPGLSGLPPAHQVGDDYTLKPFEYFRNEGGQRYVQNALSDPSEVPGYQPPPPPAPTGGIGSALPPGAGGPAPWRLPEPQTGGGEPNPNAALPSPGSGANPWGSFFQGLSKQARGPNGGSQYDPATGAESRDMRTADGVPQSWLQTQRGFNPGSSGTSLPSPYPDMMRSAVMPPMDATDKRSQFGQMATPEAGNQSGMSMPGGQSMPPWFKQFQAMFRAPQSALPAPQTTAQPLANTGYFPPPSMPAPVPEREQFMFSGGPG